MTFGRSSGTSPTTSNGSGRFTLTPTGHGTRFGWREELALPSRLGGPAGAAAAKPVMTMVWRRNLRRLKEIVEQRA